MQTEQSLGLRLRRDLIGSEKKEKKGPESVKSSTGGVKCSVKINGL